MSSRACSARTSTTASTSFRSSCRRCASDRDDILLLADHFVAKYASKMGKDVRRISTPAINMMFAYHWPGNVRELENCIEYAVLLSSDGVIHGHNLPPTLQMPDACGYGCCRIAEDAGGTVGERHDRRRAEELQAAA